jgi:hypothetical protein
VLGSFVRLKRVCLRVGGGGGGRRGWRERWNFLRSCQCISKRNSSNGRVT